MPRYLELEVSLRDVKPKVWRSFLIRDSASFAVLHQAIQDACGWQNSHLYGFFEHAKRVNWDSKIARDPHDTPEPWGGRSSSAPRADKFKLSECFAAKGDKCVYIYDFGDSWEHDVKVLQVHDLDEQFTRRLLAGERAFPLDDCGSIPGYEDIVANFNTPPKKLEEDARYLQEWVREMDPDWHPERFELARVKKSFDRVR